MKFRIIAAVVLIAGFAVFFQNCGVQVHFANATGTLLAKAATFDEAHALGDPTLIGNEPVDPTSSPHASASPSPTQSPAKGSSEGESQLHGPDSSSEVASQNSSVPVEGSLDYVCILKGPGKSLLLSYSDGELESQTSTPETVCTTENACLNIASKKFDVKEAIYHQNCEHNKHMVHVDEKMMEALISK